MRYGKIIWGIILIIFGVLLILKNTGVIYFHWWAFFKLWPFLFIFWGISVLPVKEYIKLILALLTLGCAFYMFQKNDGFSRCSDNDKDNNVTTNVWDEQILKETYDNNISTAKLYLNAAAGDFTINDTCSDLIFFSKSGDIGNYNMGIEKKGDSSKVIRIELNNKGKDFTIRGHNIKGNKVNMKLNPNPIWDMDFDIGAAEADFDLSKYRTKTIEINGGAASVKLKLGDSFYRSEVEVNTGVSSIDIMIPATSGCEITSNTFLVDKELEGFKKDDKHKYISDNFKFSSNKIYIKVNSAISSFKVTRY